MPVKNIVNFIKISSLKLTEEITDLYIYKNNMTKKFSIYYNDEIKFPYNLEKGFYKKYGKIKNFFDNIEDIEADFNTKEDLVKITYILKN